LYAAGEPLLGASETLLPTGEFLLNRMVNESRRRSEPALPGLRVDCVLYLLGK
jgi:hypothetical protein